MGLLSFFGDFDRNDHANHGHRLSRWNKLTDVSRGDGELRCRICQPANQDAPVLVQQLAEIEKR